MEKKLNIQLYDSNNQIKSFENFEYITSGACANIYKKNNIILKIYNDECKYKFQLKREVFDALKQLNNPNIVSLGDYYYHNNSKLNKILKMDAYTMEYVENDNIDILDANKEYVLDTIRDLENTLEILARNKIEIFDVHFNNVILNKTGAKLIDVDSYGIYKLKSCEKILTNNKQELMHYLRSKIKEEIKTKKRDIAFYKLQYLFKLNPNITITDTVKNLYIENTLGESLESKKL